MWTLDLGQIQQCLPGCEGGGGGEGGGQGHGGEMAQTMYAHMNKRIKKNLFSCSRVKPYLCTYFNI
jgi:hypothetical protein